MNVWQRNLKVSRLQQLRDWWFDNAAISANPSLIYFPGNDQFNDHAQGNGTDYTLDPTNWCVQVCPDCGWDVGQHDAACQNWFFDHCPECGWTEKTSSDHRWPTSYQRHGYDSASPGVALGHENEPVFTSDLRLI